MLRRFLNGFCRRQGEDLAEAAVTSALSGSVTADQLPPSPALHPKLSLNVEILAEGLGQVRTFHEGVPVDAHGAPIPWYTYPAIEYLGRLNPSGWKIFEYGSGNSTEYWVRRGARVISVEHDAVWHARMRAQALDRCILLHRPDRAAYARAILETNDAFDIVVVDGVWREDCAAAALQRLKPDGILILDNSDWYHEVGAWIRSRGYHEVSFSGFGPVNDYTWTTSIFLPSAMRLLERLGPPNPVGGNPIAPEMRGDMW